MDLALSSATSYGRTSTALSKALHLQLSPCLARTIEDSNGLRWGGSGVNVCILNAYRGPTDPPSDALSSAGAQYIECCINWSAIQQRKNTSRCICSRHAWTQPPGASAIVTGAGSGINLSFARALFEKGCNVLIADISLRPEAQAFVNSAAQKGGPKVVFEPTDVTDWAQLEKSFDVAKREFGTVPDLVCPGAGIYEPPASGFWGDVDSPSHYKLFDINLVHPIKMTRMAIRHMRRAKKAGTVVLIASVAAETVSIVTPLYQASKHAVGSFVMGMGAAEKLCGIRVVGVAPGAIATPLLLEDPGVAGWVDPTKDKMLDPSVIADAMVALAENPNERYPAGTLLEVMDETEDLWRSIPVFNNPGPARTNLVSNKDSALVTIQKILKEEAE
ncbi:hypothetical protein CLAIMM_02188 [Cladophialophora immunda]|nr:hypothetical protein CLAIMM_02188 [Cladophialophora immunda]